MESASLEGPEIFVGLVGAIGTDMPKVSDTIRETLRGFSYDSGEIRFSQLLHDFVKYKDLPISPKDTYYQKHMDAGDEFRRTFASGDALAVLGMGAIREVRKEKSGEENKPVPRYAFILNSLKHLDEVRILREIYGPRFILFAAFTPRERRLENLTGWIAESYHKIERSSFRSCAEQLISRDEKEVENRYGQNVRETFPIADFFVDATVIDEMKESIQRFLRLFFGYPFHTPTRDEYGMFHAHAAALRSSDLSRQVGAVISTDDGDIVAVGTNEVPKPGGGLYWEGDASDSRDFALGHKIDPDFKRKRTVIAEVLKKIHDRGWFNEEMASKSVDQIVDDAVKEGVLNETQFASSIPFDRTVHAEMAALTARRTVTVKDCILYTTTFPCHNCAKHIVASSIKKVIYIHPYPKSLALELHRDSISMDRPSDSHTVFKSFVGVSPSNYFGLFSMTQRKDEAGVILDWNAQSSLPRFGTPNPSYLAEEQARVEDLEKSVKNAGMQTV